MALSRHDYEWMIFFKRCVFALRTALGSQAKESKSKAFEKFPPKLRNFLMLRRNSGTSRKKFVQFLSV
jgi:hypothetical protein